MVQFRLQRKQILHGMVHFPACYIQFTKASTNSNLRYTKGKFEVFACILALSHFARSERFKDEFYLRNKTLERVKLDSKVPILAMYNFFSMITKQTKKWISWSKHGAMESHSCILKILLIREHLKFEILHLHLQNLLICRHSWHCWFPYLLVYKSVKNAFGHPNYGSLNFKMTSCNDFDLL